MTSPAELTAKLRREAGSDWRGNRPGHLELCAAAADEIELLAGLLTDVLADNHDACDHPDDCACSAARALRHLAKNT